MEDFTHLYNGLSAKNKIALLLSPVFEDMQLADVPLTHGSLIFIKRATINDIHILCPLWRSDFGPYVKDGNWGIDDINDHELDEALDEWKRLVVLQIGPHIEEHFRTMSLEELEHEAKLHYHDTKIEMYDFIVFKYLYEIYLERTKKSKVTDGWSEYE